jgi:hypothetical protein
MVGVNPEDLDGPVFLGWSYGQGSHKKRKQGWTGSFCRNSLYKLYLRPDRI